MATKKIKDGLVVEYLSNGEVESKQNYKNGKLDGKSVYWHENGQKREEGSYKNGLADGTTTSWFEDGQIEFTLNYKNGKPDGRHEVWHPNGQIRARLNHRNDRIESTSWDENGNKESKGATLSEKKDDEEWSKKRIGEWSWWHANGILSEVANYKNLVLHGHRTLYNNKGQITLFNNYENGKLLDDKDNEFIEPLGDGDIIEVALFLLKGLPNTAIKDTEFLINYASIDIFSDAGSSLRALLSYLQSELYGKYCLHYVDKDSNEDLSEKAKNEVEAFIKILQYRLYENPKLEHTDLLYDISFTKEELGIDHHRD
jgi:antitoxin component YwqK of YwqJK toxin-antitoxin module